ncbi:Uncharacterized conserved protein YbjT, contains NAD(P)-binding and DUF2867 domains [Dyadobacter soli]|uniref:Uncharacterized conserved protein YbjT, contains NAD(P)-binding and DUF2867 domains n=1 Tax=Dyadobacter soli TaxID=659014 RepID=A0A1G7PN42_9BACT|nr:NAD(P)H-binding protein [Dyadobacter soli]SDF87109.1 Uncharacterized conserved protein YbjT, contains NAD(P)-binding and DUF2867 domains [Dyadobacter soli]
MKIVVIGTGLIGSNVAKKLEQMGHTVIAGSPSTGINTLTGEGVAEALVGAEVVVDLANSPSFDEETAVSFFKTAGNNLLTAEKAAGVKHHVALSIVGVDEMGEVGYMRGKKVQEKLIRESGVPYTIIRSTQFQEFVPAIAGGSTQGNEVHVSKVAFQPIAAEDVATFVAQFALAAPANGVEEIAGPDRGFLSTFVDTYVKETGDTKVVIPNDRNEYFGAEIPQAALAPTGEAHLGKIRFQQFIESALVK